jgi:acetoin utilization protein AcuC
MSTRAAVVWTPQFLSYDLGDDHPLDPVRLDLTMRLATELGVMEGIEPVVPEPAPDEEIQRIHVPSFLSAVKSAPETPFGIGHGLGTDDNPIFFGMHEASALICGGSLAAAREIAEGRAERAVNIAGGLHHAMADRAAGFCVYNDCAVAISWLLDHGFERIAYVDVDVHHGDGVQAAFYDDPRVLTAFRPQLLVTQCGADTHREDPLADLGLSVDGHREIYRRLRELATHTAGGRWLATGGGGYGLFRVVPRSWTHLIATVLDRDVAGDTAIPPRWTAHTAALTGRELPTTMTENASTAHEAWGDGHAERVDLAILETRRAVFPLHGLDPDDPRD